MNAVIACGGTGGHLFPGIAVAEVLRERGHEVMLLVSEKDIDALALSGRESFRVEKLPTVGLPSPFSPAFFGFLRRFYESLRLCRSIYTTFKPQVILGMGGFTSTAPVLAGRIRGIPTFIHESNAIPGKANRMTARLVRAVMLGFKECAPFFPKTNTEVTGTPVRTELIRLDQLVARQKLGLREDVLTLLVMFARQRSIRTRRNKFRNRRCMLFARWAWSFTVALTCCFPIRAIHLCSRSTRFPE